MELQILDSHSKLSRSPEAEIHIFERIGRAEVRKWNFRSLVVDAERKYGSLTSDVW